MEYLFFELLQVAVGNRTSLSRVPTEGEWGELFAIGMKQALVGICFVGVQKMRSAGVLSIPEVLYLKWLGMAAKIQQRNKLVNSACKELVKLYKHDGIQCCILKGQGNQEYYTEELREARTSGDIDVWCSPIDTSGIDIAVSDFDGKGAHYEKYHGKRAVIEYVKMLHRIAGAEPHEGVRYHHIDAPSINGVEVEAHFRPLFLDSPLRNHRLQEWFSAQSSSCFGTQASKLSGVIPIPTVSFNVVYQLCHIYRHLFDEGIGLRQLLDYYFVLRNLPDSQHGEIVCTLSRFGMKKFAGAVMWVLRDVFDTPLNPPEGGKIKYAEWQTRWSWMICLPDEKEGRFLLNEIMQAGNFGKYDVRIKHGGSQWQHAWEKTKHNFRLLSHYPEEVLWEPFFRLYHWIWRKFELWRLGI